MKTVVNDSRRHKHTRTAPHQAIAWDVTFKKHTTRHTFQKIGTDENIRQHQRKKTPANNHSLTKKKRLNGDRLFSPCSQGSPGGAPTGVSRRGLRIPASLSPTPPPLFSVPANLGGCSPHHHHQHHPPRVCYRRLQQRRRWRPQRHARAIASSAAPFSRWLALLLSSASQTVGDDGTVGGRVCVCEKGVLYLGESKVASGFSQRRAFVRR